MPLILHITHTDQWQQAKLTGSYRADTLDSEGFIHCSTPQQVVWVANTFYRSQASLVLLCIDSDKVQAEIKYEGVEGGEQFPHVYGELNLNAVMDVLDFPPGENELFTLPNSLAMDSVTDVANKG